MEEDKNLQDQTIALLKILEIGRAQIDEGQVETMDAVFEQFAE